MKNKQNFFRKSKVIIYFGALAILASFLFSITTEVFSSEPPTWTYYIDSTLCVGCGECEAIAPEYFIVVDDIACVI